jgi:hypothetical protein
METDALIPMTSDENYYDKVKVGEVVELGGTLYRVKGVFRYDEKEQGLKVRLAPLRQAIRR